MHSEDERVRDAITDAFTQAGIDSRNLAVEVVSGMVLIKGSVPTEQQRDLIGPTLVAADPGLAAARLAVSVIPVAPTDSLDGRGRSPVTGTSADSAHESRHQLDP